MINPNRREQRSLSKPSQRNGAKSKPTPSPKMSNMLDKPIQKHSAKSQNERFEELKRIVRSGLQTAFEVGAALLEIRESKLYRQEFDTFEEFCESEFKIVRQRAYQLIKAVEVKKSLPAAAADVVTNARQAAALASVPEEKRAEVITEVAESGSVTAKRISEAASKKAKPDKIIELDKTGYPIPESVLDDWREAETFTETLHALSRIKCRIEKGLNDKELAFAEVGNSALAMLKNAYGELKAVLPYAVCTTCQGRGRSSCTFCKKRGFISEFAYKQYVPAEAKKIREAKGK